MEREYCKIQIQRLSGMAFFPTFAPAVTELIDTLADCTQDADHARLVVDECVRQHGCPEPVDIRRIALQVKPPEFHGCKQCRGAGFVSFQRSVDGVLCDFARRCACNPAAGKAA